MFIRNMIKMTDDKKILKIFFNGLPQEITKEIINLSSITRISGGEFLESDSTDTICIVLQGTLLIFSSEDEPSPLMKIEAGSCARQTLKRIIARNGADDFTLVMIISRQSMDMMNEKAQLFIHRKIFASESARISDCISNLERCETKAKKLAKALEKAGSERHKDLSEFEPVTKVLAKVQRLPSSVEDLMTMITTEKITARVLADKVKNDPSITALVLRRINSSYYCLEKKISDINYAIFYLGMDQIYQVILSESLRATLSANHEFQKLYFHSVIISHISSEIARLALTSQPAVASTIALLHDLGQNVKFILKEQNPKINELIDFLDSSEIGFLLLKSWNIPEFVADVVRFHMHPEFMNPDRLQTGIRPAAVNLYVSHLVYDFLENPSMHPKEKAYSKECLDFLGWGDYCVKELCKKVLVPEFERRASFYPESFLKFLKIK